MKDRKEEQRVARMRASRIIEMHCQGCERNSQLRGKEDLSYCRFKCPYGRQLAKIGSLLEGGVSARALSNPYYRTEEEWDDLCQKALEMRAAGVGVREIMSALKVAGKTLHQKLDERGMSIKPEGANRATKNGRTPLTPELVQNLRKQGLKYKEISLRYGYAEGYVNLLVVSWRKKGLWKDEGRPQPTAEEMFQLRAEGKSFEKIGKLFGYSARHIRRLYEQHLREVRDE